MTTIACASTRAIRRHGGAELLVLEGEIDDGHRSYAPGTWIRLPAGAQPGFSAGRQGVRFYLKTGHLASPG
jgi:hypothetical protein